MIDLISQLNWQTIIAMFAIGWYFTREIRSTLINLENDVSQQGKRTDKLYESLIELKNEQSKRTDDLYKMFIDLVKEGRK